MGYEPLAGRPLFGWSKYNYPAGLLYDKKGLSGRLIWTFRSKYINGDNTGGVAVRPYDESRPIDDPYLPVFLSYVRPAGRLDFSIGYDVTDALRLEDRNSTRLNSSY